MSLTLASRQVLMASIVSARPVAMGFSQNTCLPAAAHACRQSGKGVRYGLFRQVFFCRNITPWCSQSIHTVPGTHLDLVGVKLGGGADPHGVHLGVVDHLVARGV